MRDELRGVIDERHDHAEERTPQSSRQDVGLCTRPVQSIVCRYLALDYRNRSQRDQELQPMLHVQPRQGRTVRRGSVEHPAAEVRQVGGEIWDPDAEHRDDQEREQSQAQARCGGNCGRHAVLFKGPCRGAS